MVEELLAHPMEGLSCISEEERRILRDGESYPLHLQTTEASGRLRVK